MRRSEILRLRWSDVDGAVVRVRDGKTPQARREISIPPVTIAALRRHRAEQAERRLVCGETWTDSGLVVDRGDGQAVHPDVMTRAFERAAERAKLHGVRLHDLRHSFASVLLMAGVPVKIVSAQLGQAKSAFTMDVYGHFMPGAEGAGRSSDRGRVRCRFVVPVGRPVDQRRSDTSQPTCHVSRHDRTARDDSG